jgi:acyl-CoA thioesterase
MHPFDEGITVIRQNERTFHGTISGDWSINDTPNGGYLMALCARVAQEEGAKGSLAILTTAFLARSGPGRVELSLQHLGASRQFERYQVHLSQAGELKAAALATLANRADPGAEVRMEAEAPSLPPAESCIPMPEMPGYTLFSRLDVRLDPACAGWMTGALTDRSEIRGWVRFQDDRSPDELALLCLADSFPPAVLASQGMVAWVPTIECSVNLRQLPTTAWLIGRFRSRFLHHGMVEEDGELWDEAGSLVALSRQIAQFRKAG